MQISQFPGRREPRVRGALPRKVGPVRRRQPLNLGRQVGRVGAGRGGARGDGQGGRQAAPQVSEARRRERCGRRRMNLGNLGLVDSLVQAQMVTVTRKSGYIQIYRVTQNHVKQVLRI